MSTTRDYERAAGQTLVAARDGKPGCPEPRWDGGYRFRCSMGRDECHLHGPFETLTVGKRRSVEL